MKLISKLFVLVVFVLCSTSLFASSLSLKVHNEIAYFFEPYGTQVFRYSLGDEAFLSPILLNRTVFALHVDDAGITLMSDNRTTAYPVYQYNLEGDNETLLLEVEERLERIDSIGNFLILSSISVLGTDHIYSVNKQTGAIVDDLSLSFPVSGNSIKVEFSGQVAVDSSLRRIYFVSRNQGDSVYVRQSANLDEAGNFQLNDISIEQSNNHHDLYHNEQADYVVSNFGQLYAKQDLSLITTLKESIDGEEVNHAFVNLLVWNSRPLTHVGNKLSLFEPSGTKIGAIQLARNACCVVLNNNKVYAFNIFSSSTTASVEIVDVDELAPRPSIPVDPATLSFVPDYSALDKDGDTLYMFAVGQYDIFRWSLSEQKYMTPISLQSLPDFVAYSAHQNKLYVVYGRTINALDLSSMEESVFVSLPYDIDSLLVTDEFVIVKDKRTSGNTALTRVFDLSGTEGTTVATQPEDQLVYSDVLNRLYQLSNTTRWWFDFSPTAEIILSFSQIYQTQDVRWSQASVSETGEVLASSSGEIVNASSLEALGLYGLANNQNLSFTTWIHGNLFTYRQIDESINRGILSRYQADFSENTENTFDVNGKPIALLSNADKNQLVLISLIEDAPVVYTYDVFANDFDGDGVNDLPDEFPINPNLTAFVPSTFFPLSGIDEWLYSDNLTIKLGELTTIYGRQIKPLELSTGGKLYINNANDELTFNGFYLPEVTVLGTSYTVDLLLENEIPLNKKGGNFTGGGKVTISPDFGEKSFVWEASINYLGDQTVDSNNKQYDTVAFEVVVNATANVSGNYIALQYNASLYFAENIGLVRIDEPSGNDFKLLDVKETSIPDNNQIVDTPPVQNASSGGSLWLPHLIVLLLIVARRRRDMFR